MQCPKCSSLENDVIDSRAASQAVRRRRQCCICSYRFTTYERIERPRLMVIKKGGERESFNREKLTNGIDRACEKRNISKSQIDTIVDTIECYLFDKNEAEVSSSEIGEKVMAALASIDEVAYVRFASVYREFTDIKSFAAVVEMLNKQS